MNKRTLKNIKIAGLALMVGAVLTVVMLRLPQHSFASAAQNISGLLFSDMPDGSDHNKTPANLSSGSGLGWVSLNDTTDGSSTQYGANAELTSTGLITGQGWSEYGGWLTFTPGGSFPTGPGTTSSNAKIDPTCLTDVAQTNCPVVGWARFLAGGTAQSSGWDGWVSLHGGGTKGNGVPYGVDYNKTTHQFSGYAWGDDVVGWVNFNQAVVAVADLTCTDASGNVYTYPVGGIPPKPCANIKPKLTCQDPAGVTYFYNLGDPVPKQCTMLSCTDKNGNVYTYPIGGIVPIQCSPVITKVDLCANLAGYQSVLPTNYPGDANYPAGWYYDPTGNGECILDKKPPHGGCMNKYANNYDPTATFDVPGSCTFDVGPGRGPGTKPINPIYKEN